MSVGSFLCSDLVEIAPIGRTLRMRGLLQEVDALGGVLLTVEQIERGSTLVLESRSFLAPIHARASIRTTEGYLTRFAFESGFRWDPEIHHPAVRGLRRSGERAVEADFG